MALLNRKMNNNFERLPSELLINIACALPSLADIRAFTSTYRRLQHIWAENASFIYHHMTTKIERERDARILLEAQVGTVARAQELSAQDVLRLERNARLVERAIQRFNNETARLIPNVKPSNVAISVEGHPPHLTATERRRFTGAYYQLWALILLTDPDGRQRRLDELTLKQLYLMMEIAHLPSPIGDVEHIPASVDDEARMNLRREIWHEIDQKFRRLFGCAAYPLEGESNHNGPAYGHVCMFDYFQEVFRVLLLGGWSAVTSEIKQWSWPDDSDQDE